MNNEDRLKKLESQVTELKYQLGVLQSLIIHNRPSWAIEANEIANENGMFDSPHGGGLDYYRLITYLHDKGIL